MSEESRKDNHEFGDNAINELSQHLYKSPKSAIKEATSNGLDQQDKNARIEIFTNVSPDGDIIIEDWGTGIENYDDFRTGLRGFKSVGDRISSYQTIDPGIAGNKGLGKYSFLMLSGTDPPTVEFYSHRPKVEGKYKALGMKVTMFQRVKDGFISEPMDTTEALEHPGVKVVIKNAKDILPRDSSLMQYLSKVYAIRIANGAKIFLNGNQILPPEDFDPKEEPLFIMDDGTVISGNLKAADKSQSNNIQVFIKTIFVDDLSFEHKVTGWINDNLLIPTSSRESIEETTRYREFHEKLTAYLDEYFEKPTSEKLSRMPNEKQKIQLGLKLIQHQKERLSGEFDETSLFLGDITGGMEKGKKWIKKTGMFLTNTGGDENAPPIIPIGPGTRHPGTRHGGTGTKPGIEAGGDHDILTTENNTPRLRVGPIRANLKYIYSDAGFDKPPSEQINENKVLINTSWPQSKKAYKSKGQDWEAVFLPVVAPAFINYEIKIKEENLSNEEWQKRLAEYVRVGLEE